MTKRKKLKKILRYTLTALLVLGLVFLTGFLSFAGVLALNGSILLAVFSFLLAGGIEGEVYAQNVNKSFIKLFRGDYLEDLLLARALNDLAKKHAATSSFLANYNALIAYIAKLHAKKHHSKELAKARKKLKVMQQYFKDFVYGKLKQQTKFSQELSQLLPPTEINNLLTSMRRKKWLSRASLIVSVLAGLSAGLVAIQVAQTSITALVTYLGISIGASAMGASVFGLAALAAVGYTFLIYNTVTDMIHNDTVQKWFHKIKDFCKRRTNEPNSKYIPRLIFAGLGTACVIALGVFATVLTAGTWWYAAKAGAALIPTFAKAAAWLRNIFVPIMASTSLIFSVTNSLQTVKEITKISLRKSFENLKEKIKSYFETENLAQKLNPFRALIIVISAPFKFVIFIGHLVSMAFTNESAPSNLPVEVSLGVNILNEAGQDLHYFMPEHEHHGDAGHGHTHTDLPGKFLTIVLLPVYLLGATWDWLISKFNQDKSHVLTLKEALGKIFIGMSYLDKTSVPAPVLAQDWSTYATQYRIQGKIAKAIEKKEITVEEESTLNELGQCLFDPPQDSQPVPSWYSEGRVDRVSFFSTHSLKSQKSIALAEKMINETEEEESIISTSAAPPVACV